MFKLLLDVLRNKRGSASMMWLAMIPVFLLIFFFLANLAIAGMTHASSNKAAESGAIAAIDTLDKWLLDEVKDDIEYPDHVLIQDLSTKEKLEYADQGKLKKLAKEFMANHQDQLETAVRKYVEENGGDTKEGAVILPVQDKHIQVQAQSEYEPIAFKRVLANEYIGGKGLSPGRDYLTSIEELKIDYGINHS